MTDHILEIPACFADKADQKTIILTICREKDYPEYAKELPEGYFAQTEQISFSAKKGQCAILHDKNGLLKDILVGVGSEITIYSLCAAVMMIKQTLSKKFLDQVCFKVVENGFSKDDLTKLCIGWGLANYVFDAYKKCDHPNTKLLWPKGADVQRAETTIEAVCLVRNLINTPANILGTDELADIVEQIAGRYKASFNRIVGDDLLTENFPLIHAVGKGSPRPPQLIEFNWGNDDHPTVTLVGKGIVYDTGGLNLKPKAFIRHMKKDMGGAAHVLGLAMMIMEAKLPIRLRVLIPSAENSISGESFRPGDILKSRKGLTVEIDDTDAEGRLVVSDALAYACEDETPDLLIDFCTLTGAARVALGYDIPAFFSNKDDMLEPMKQAGMGNDDPIWPLPLWPGYEKDINTPVADVLNDGLGRAGAIEAALFLQRFIDKSVPWVHFDCYAWEQSGRPGRPQGGADTGMRAVFHYLEDRYGNAA